MVSKSSKRYYWHRKLKVLGLNYDARANTIFIGFGAEEEDLPKPALVLRDKFGYNIQIEIE